MRDEVSERDGSPVVVDLEVGHDETALLAEAAELTGVHDPAELLRIALRELIERRRFQRWARTAAV